MTSVTAIAGAALWIGPAPIVAPWDVFTLLNGAYRIYEGQAPSTDFSNPIGPLVYGLAAIGMHLQHGTSLRAVTYGQVIFLALASVLAWLVSSRRLPGLYAMAFTVFVAFLSVSVRPLGYSPWTTTYAMLYNRDGWLLYSTLLLLVFLPRLPRFTDQTRRSGAVDGLILGVLLGLLFYDKITFFIAGLAAVGLGLALRTLPRNWRLTAAAVGGVLVVGVAVRILFRLSTTAYLRDVIEAAKVQVASHRAGMLADTIIWTAPVTIVTAVLVGVLLAWARREPQRLRQTVLFSLAVAFVLCSSILLSAGNADEKSDLPALVVIPLLAVAFLQPVLPRWAGGAAASRSRAWPKSAYPALLVAVALLLVGTTAPIVGKDLLSLGKTVHDRGQVTAAPAGQQFDAAALNEFVIPADAQWETAYRVAHEVPSMINNGLQLLRQNIRSGDDTVFTLAYTDPFSMALHTPLSDCGLLWWDLGYDFNLEHHPSAGCAIGDADWVMIPRMIKGQGCCQATVSVMLRLYSGYLSRHYQEVQETSDWILLRRKR